MMYIIDIILDENDKCIEFQWNDQSNQPETKIVNPDLEGEQKDCPKGDVTKNYIEDDNKTEDNDEHTDEEIKTLLENNDISKLYVNRIYRYMDKCIDESSIGIDADISSLELDII